MIEMRQDELVFTFPEVHAEARLGVNLQRTLRIPDDGKDYALPPGLGRFPLRHVDDFRQTVPPAWVRHGGVTLPMYQSEALWLHFNANHTDERGSAYPFAVKVAAGKINAVTGDGWEQGLRRTRDRQNYMVSPTQPWLDGYCVEKGVIRQFVAMPLGSGYSAEEQITGEAEFGGIQVEVFPMKADVFERRFPKRPMQMMKSRSAALGECLAAAPCADLDMALAPGGRMKQQVYDDPFDLDDWDLTHSSRCFIHICNSLVWEAVTGQQPPTTPPTAKQYTKAGLPWFDYYDDRASAVDGYGVLNKLKSVVEMAWQKKDNPLPENESVQTGHVVKLAPRRTRDEVREGVF